MHVMRVRQFDSVKINVEPKGPILCLKPPEKQFSFKIQKLAKQARFEVLQKPENMPCVVANEEGIQNWSWI